MSATIKIELNEKLYLRDPEQTELGRNIISESISMIDEIGFEQFTFKKLAAKLNSTEASVYRYFENKHKLLIYLISWYWVWLDYKITFCTNNISDPEEKLRIFIKIISRTNTGLDTFTHINEEALYRIVIAESSKAYLTKDVDQDNKEGFFKEYKSVCKKVGNIILQINSSYPYPVALASTLFEAGKKQIFFAQHLTSLTEASIRNDDYSSITAFLEHLAFSAIFNPKFYSNGIKH
ncbi:TetR/AcrR family transcriptional regulator [Rhodocytophaga rosea]|uniref:TetR/AcrR family transcriptional regulator n=1 Tax=Rhodocytophaga rosea TaxID=2704465 RepID=A0A6C0GNC6_9BACT|nr:TetR/AcrR family transcriptional regulator [Rhodocytophaga rosea]QHT69437.1 TetR/AcrR family transcriptional regulator [Rhodocytophaga rosea]